MTELSIIIPAHNPETTFISDMKKIIALHPDWQIIIIDDGSDHHLHDFFEPAPNAIIIRHDTPKGAGESRNEGIKAASGRHTLFMDDDDFMNWDVIQDLITQMTENPKIDMTVSSCQFLTDGLIKPIYAGDLNILNNILKKNENPVISLENNEELLKLANFPWTKLYRTDFIHRIKLRFSKTAVQNDVFAHWQSLLNADLILVTKHIQCTKVENRHGHQISNISDHRRLEAFIALRETYDLVQKTHLNRAEPIFWSFYLNLLRWMFDITSPKVHPDLMREHVTFSGLLPPDINLEKETGTKPWELWHMNHLEKYMDPDEGENLKICLTEISRLKKLAHELHLENDEIRRERDGLARERDGLAREVNSKAAQMAFKLRTFYRTFVPRRFGKTK